MTRFNFNKIIGFILLLALAMSITACDSNNWEKINYTDEEIESYTKSFNEGHLPWRSDPLEVVHDFFYRNSDDYESMSNLLKMDNMLIRYNVGADKYLELKLEYLDNNQSYSRVSKYRYINENKDLPDWIDTQYIPEHEPYTFSDIQTVSLDFIESQLENIEYNDITKTELYLQFENSQNTLDCLLIQPSEESGYWLVKEYLMNNK